MVNVELVDATKPEGFRRALELVTERPYSIERFLEAVAPIVRKVADEGYEAARRYSEELDGVGFEDPLVGVEEAGRYMARVPERTLRALREAVRRTYRFHEAMMPPRRVRVPGGWVEWAPIESVGVYVPGGRHPYPSTAVMTVVPARVAEVKRVYVATPPCMSCGGLKVNPLIASAAFEAGADAVIALGGPQAIASMAYGCKPVPRVDKIVGPGSGYVQAAKLLVSHMVGIDMVAGPTELAVVAGCEADPRVVASEMAAQAEHGPDSIVVLVSLCSELAKKTLEVLKSLWSNGMGSALLIVVDRLEEAARLIAAMAPEHLYLEGVRPEDLGEATLYSGVVSIGAPTAFLDYVAGPSHVLPTGGSARWRGGLSAYDFLKPVAFVAEYDREGLKAAVELARAEGFEAHARSLELRVVE